MKRGWLQILQVVLGILIGALITLSVVKYRDAKHLVNTRYGGSWAKLNLVLDLLEKNYVDTLDRTKLSESTISAALASLDPHSVYLPPVELSESEEDLAGNFDGIGIQFNVPQDTAIVLEVIPGGPSEKVGLRAGDRLLKVDERTIAGVKFPQDSMVRLIKGPSGSKVTITVKRSSEVIPFEITRGKIPVHSVDAAFMLSDSVAYLRLSKFSRTTFKECHEAAVRLQGEGMKHLLFDVRANTGGYMDQALLLSNDFLSKGDTIVYIEGLHRPREVFRADGRGSFPDLGLTVLIGENSASASEIFAGAIQDNDRGTIVGRRSFGKGLVQEPFFFSDNSGVRLTVARYYTPSGRCIQKPYNAGEDYSYDIYRRYAGGEIFSADSVKFDKSDVHHTRSGRIVYGGGGIMPDVFVPMDTTRTTAFYQQCTRKATSMRFASAMFDRYGSRLSDISSFADMDTFLRSENIAGKFLRYAADVDKIRCTDSEWAKSKPYMLPEVYALVSRYSRLGENAFYKYWLPVDTTVEAALRL